jgi:uncharacterized membrane protein
MPWLNCESQLFADKGISLSFVTIDQTILLALVVAVSVIASILSERTRVGKALSSTIIAIVLGILLSNVSLIPREAELYNHIFTYVVPLAVPLFLFESQWSRILAESGRLLYLFATAALGVVIGAVIAIQFVELGAAEAAWAGTFSASYIGGTINFVAVSTSLELPLDDVAIALSTDTVMGALLLMILVSAPAVNAISRFLPGTGDLVLNAADDSDQEDQLHRHRQSKGAIAWSQALGLGASIAIVLAATALANAIGIPQYSVLVITIVTLLTANLAPELAQRMKHSFSVGIVLMLAFFFVIGASADISTMIESGKEFMVFLSILILVHLIFVVVVSKLFRFSISEAVIASCACAIGPTIAAGIAANKKWKMLVAPGIVCGVLGYSIANFIGVGLATALK